MPIKIYGPRERKLLHRDKLLPALVEGRTVLHVGCASMPVAEKELADGRLLHPMLVASAASVTGIDLSGEGIEFLRSKGFDDLHVMNAERMDLGRTFDVVMAGDVLEHMSNPGLFLEQVPDLLSPGGKLVVAVPCAFPYYSFRFWATGVEGVNPDHVAYYSPLTLCELTSRYDLLPVSLAFTCRFARGRKRFRFLYSIRDFLLARAPSMSGAIAMQFMKKDEVDPERYFEIR